LASQLSHWRRAPVVLQEAFLLRSTLSKRFRSYRIIIIINYLPSPIHFAALLPLAESWISIAVFVDVAVTYVVKLLLQIIRSHIPLRLSLFYYLRRSKTGFKSKSFAITYQAAICSPKFSGTDNVIERLIRTAIETASIGAVFCVCGLPFSARLCIYGFHNTDRYQSPLLLCFTTRPHLHVSIHPGCICLPH
jgi:hypothetical protein